MLSSPHASGTRFGRWIGARSQACKCDVRPGTDKTFQARTRRAVVVCGRRERRRRRALPQPGDITCAAALWSTQGRNHCSLRSDQCTLVQSVHLENVPSRHLDDRKLKGESLSRCASPFVLPSSWHSEAATLLTKTVTRMAEGRGSDCGLNAAGWRLPPLIAAAAAKELCSAGTVAPANAGSAGSVGCCPVLPPARCTHPQLTRATTQDEHMHRVIRRTPLADSSTGIDNLHCRSVVAC